MITIKKGNATYAVPATMSTIRYSQTLSLDLYLTLIETEIANHSVSVLEVSPTSLEFTSEGGTLTVQITSNTNWIIDTNN